MPGPFEPGVRSIIGGASQGVHEGRTCILCLLPFKRLWVSGCRSQIVGQCCGRVYTCRRCHDEEEDHPLKVEEVTHMVCMLCGSRQPCAGKPLPARCICDLAAESVSSSFAICILLLSWICKPVLSCACLRHVLLYSMRAWRRCSLISLRVPRATIFCSSVLGIVLIGHLVWSFTMKLVVLHGLQSLFGAFS